MNVVQQLNRIEIQTIPSHVLKTIDVLKEVTQKVHQQLHLHYHKT